MYTIELINIFIILVAISFSRYDHHQTDVIEP